ncbi:bifunctional DNA primase/polymerase [Bacillus cereus]|nr:bifunctional DNA primase/polymerase [Bacillus cereus]
MVKQILEHALYIANLGIGVIAGFPNGKGIIKGTSTGTTDIATIEKWWKQIPERNLYISLRNSGLIMIDCDNKSSNQNGLDEFIQLCASNGDELPATYTEIGLTGEHSRHLFFKIPPEATELRFKECITDNIEVKASFTPIYPSKVKDKQYKPCMNPKTNKPYTLNDIAPIPLWLLDLVIDTEQFIITSAGVEMKETSTGKMLNEIAEGKASYINRGNKYSGDIIWAEICAGAEVGNRHIALNKQVFKLKWHGVTNDNTELLITLMNDNSHTPLNKREINTLLQSSLNAWAKIMNGGADMCI